MYLKMIRATFPGRAVAKGGKNWAIFGLRCTVFEICMLEGDYVVRKSMSPLISCQTRDCIITCWSCIAAWELHSYCHHLLIFSSSRPTDRPHALSPVHRSSVRRPSVAGGLSVGPGSTVHVCGLTAVVVQVSGYTTPVCLLMVRGPVCIWYTGIEKVTCQLFSA